MKTETLLKLQSWIDGELPASEAAKIEALVRDDAQLRALAAELRGLRRVMCENEPSHPLPCAPEFYWNGIQQGMDAAEGGARSAPVRAHRLPWWLRVLTPLGAGMAALLAILLSLSGGSSALPSGAYAEIDTPLSDVGSITFRSETEHMTVVWVDTR